MYNCTQATIPTSRSLRVANQIETEMEMERYPALVSETLAPSQNHTSKLLAERESE